MFGMSLIHAGFLAAAAAVSIPILIHLLLRPRARQVSIGTLRFLRLAIKETRRRRKIRRWLLLAMRTAAVLLLALLFARPYLTASVSRSGPRSRSHRVGRSVGQHGGDVLGRDACSPALKRRRRKSSPPSRKAPRSIWAISTIAA